jgi:hypothetical protein
VPARFVARAYIDQLADGTLQVAQRIPKNPPGPNHTVLVTDSGVFHYFHLMETVIWLWTLQHAYLGKSQLERIVFTLPWENARPHQVQRAVLSAVFPGIPIGDIGWPWPASFDNVLIYNRDWVEHRLNKSVEACLGFGRPHVMDMSRQVRRTLGAFEGRTTRPQILYVTRPPPRCFTPEAEHELLECLCAYGDVKTIDFALLPWEQQVRVSAAHDVMVGVHGNGLTNALWMRPGSLVLEFFPANVRHYDYQFFAELAGLSYFGFQGMDKIFPAFSRTGAPYGHGKPTQEAVFQMPLAGVRLAFDHWMAR